MTVNGHKRAAGMQDVTEFIDAKRQIFTTAWVFSAVLPFPCCHYLTLLALSHLPPAIFGDQ